MAVHSLGLMHIIAHIHDQFESLGFVGKYDPWRNFKRDHEVAPSWPEPARDTDYVSGSYYSLSLLKSHDQSPTVDTLFEDPKYGGADFLRNPRIFSLQNGLRMRAYGSILQIVVL
jgi:hypothetical protein